MREDEVGLVVESILTLDLEDENLREGLRPPASPDPFIAAAKALLPFRLVPGDSGLSWE